MSKRCIVNLIVKGTKNRNKHFIEEKIQMINEHLRSCSKSLIEKCKLNRNWCYLHPLDWQKCERIITIIAGCNMRKWAFSYICRQMEYVWESHLVTSTEIKNTCILGPQSYSWEIIVISITILSYTEIKSLASKIVYTRVIIE